MYLGHFWWSSLKGCRHRPLLENFGTVSSHYMGPWLQAVKNHEQSYIKIFYLR